MVLRYQKLEDNTVYVIRRIDNYRVVGILRTFDGGTMPIPYNIELISAKSDRGWQILQGTRFAIIIIQQAEKELSEFYGAVEKQLEL